MRHGMAHRKLNRTSEHRKAMFKNMLCSLMNHECIRTTLPKAKELRPIAEKMITLGKKFATSSDASKLHIRRQAIAKLGSEVTANKVLTVIAERFKDRNGGYLRIIKAGARYGDNAPMAMIGFIDHEPAAMSSESAEPEIAE